MKYRLSTRFIMWYFDMKRILDFYGQPGDMINSPFAFPRLPPRANLPLGISNAGRIKEDIVNDTSVMIGRLSDHHSMFRRYAAGLFNLVPDRFVPGHPIYSKVQTTDTLQEANEKLVKENAVMKSNLNKEKK